MGDDARARILETLQQQAIPYQLAEHPPAFTMADIEAYGLNAQGLVAKNLFLRDAKGKRHFLVVVAGDKPADLKTLGAALGTRLSFASAERLEKYLCLQQGEVSPLGVLQDEARAVEVFFDEDLRGQARVGVHPGTNAATIFLSFENLEKIVKNHGNKVAFTRV
ncbi:MAG: prolyl-tRNA synthetase associated domain-containing protein [Ruminococcaceae bacterium]|nr:prolyl-tRNA synthetase associated domain-containing protein [Oscillospiraceae bacterium]